MQKSKKKKPTPRKPARKAVKKKVTKKKTAARKKTTAKKKTLRKNALKKTAKKKSVRRTAPRSTVAPKPLMVEPGPPPGSVPPVEEPAPREEAIGVVTHYYSHLGVAVVQINKGTLSTGETVHFTGHTTDFTQTVESMEYEHRHVDQASAGQSVGIRVKDHAREHDIMFRVK